MRRTVSLMVVLWAVVAAEMGVGKCRGWADEAVTDVKNNISKVNEITKLSDKVEAVKTGVSEVFSDAKDTAASWTSWAHHKLSKGFRYSEEELKETAQSMADKAGDAAKKTTQKINTAASDASNYASEKAGEAVKAAAEKASDVTRKAKQNLVRAASEKAADVKTKAKEKLVSGKEKAAEMYEAAKTEVEQKLEEVKDCDNCEDAREMVSKAAGEIKATIRENTAEL